MAILAEENPRPLKRFKTGPTGETSMLPECLVRDFRDVPPGLLSTMFESTHYNLPQTRQVLRQLIDDESEFLCNRSRKRTHTGRLIPDSAYSRGPEETVAAVLSESTGETRHSALASCIMTSLMSAESHDAAHETLTEFLKSFESRLSESTNTKNEDVLRRAVRSLAREIHRLKQTVDEGRHQVDERDRLLADNACRLKRLQDVNARLVAKLAQADLDANCPWPRFDDPPPPVC